MEKHVLERIMELASSDKRIMELSGDMETINVPVDPRIDVGVLTADDPDPMFVNLEVIRTGVSKTNNRRYNGMVVSQIASLIPGTQAFLGHPDPDKASFEFREPHSIYVGSQVQELEDGGKRALAKAYIFKSSPLREWVPKSIAAGNPLTVSINGTGDIAIDMTTGIKDVLTMNSLDSIDWANPGTEGVGTAQALSVVSELQGGDQVERVEIIKGATLTELQEHNPTLVTAIQEGAKITEISLMVDGAQKPVKISELQSVLDAKDTKIAELQGTIATKDKEIATAKITEYKNTKIAELVPEQYREAVSKRVTGADNASIDASITTELAFIQEIAGNNYNQGRGKGRRTDDGEDMAEKIKGLFGVKKDPTK